MPSPTRDRVAVRTRGSVKRSIAGSLEELIARLRGQATSVRLEVVQELLKRADNLALAVLRALVEHPDPDPTVRHAIADGLADVSQAEAIELLESLAKDDTRRNGPGDRDRRARRASHRRLSR